MPFKILLSEEISPAVRRIAIEQLTRARRELSAANNMQEGVHQSRKSLKRLRSLLKLARPIIGKEVYASENKTYRDLGRALARPRDAGALVETLMKFETREDMARFKPLTGALKRQLLEDKKGLEAELEIVALSHIVETLDASIARWRSMPLPKAEFEDIAHGFARCYERGRESLKVALFKNKSFYMHEWRKDVQQTWRHMQILTLLWPEDIMPRIRLAQDISRLMGTEHDISELLNYMKLRKRQLKKIPEVKGLRKPFQQIAKTTQRDLCLHAAERGRRLYAFEARAIEEAMAVYWRTARAMQPLPGLVGAMANLNPAPKAKLQEMRGSREKNAAKHAIKQDKTTTPKGARSPKIVPISDGLKYNQDSPAKMINEEDKGQTTSQPHSHPDQPDEK